ncbi:hypothetical protein ACS0TY_015878 [Phlomoides rotata]
MRFFNTRQNKNKDCFSIYTLFMLFYVNWMVPMQVLNVMPSEVGYFQLDNDFSSMGEEYLLGVEFAESITNLDYGSSEGIQASVSESRIQVSSAGSDTTSKTDPFRTLDVPECQKDQYNVRSSHSSDIPSPHEHGMLVVWNPFPPRSCTSQNIGKFHNSSSSSFEDTLSDENDGRFSPAGDGLCSPKTEKDDVFELIGQDQDGARNISQGQEASAMVLVQAICSDVLPTQKRSRKPTQRYIDEFVDPSSTNFKKRREVSSTRKDKSRGVKDRKKCLMGPKSVKPSPEEFSVIAIQVPFASLGNKECPDDHANDDMQLNSTLCGQVPYANSGYPVTKSKGKCVTPQNQNRMDKYGIGKRNDFATSQKKMEKRDDYATRGKNMDGCVTPAQSKKRDPHSTASGQKKRNECTTMALIPNKKDDSDNCRTIVHLKENDDCPTAESTMEVNGRRKHHRVWSITEVRKLIDGVSQYGVGRWSRIKKLFFSASPHRTSVDLKDKWRNLLKASGVLEQGNQQGEKKRNMAWRPLPKSILRRVCELATMYPYPKGQRHKIAHFLHDSPDRSTDITLSDYRRILRSINDS